MCYLRSARRSRALARDGAPGLHACAFFYPGTVTWAFGAHACALEVDVETGSIRLLRYADGHDCGRPINPMVVEGQLLTGSLMDYGLPTATQVPPIEAVPLDHPSVMNELGIKGVGESGVICPAAAIANAVEDALSDRGVLISRVPLTPARVRDALR